MSTNLKLYKFILAGNEFNVAANTLEEAKKKFDEFASERDIKGEYLESILLKGVLIL